MHAGVTHLGHLVDDTIRGAVEGGGLERVADAVRVGDARIVPRVDA
jgi:hypothetical protein